MRVEDYKPLLDVEGKKMRVHCWKGIKLELNWKKKVDNMDRVDQNLVHYVQDVHPKSPFKLRLNRMSIWYM